MSAILYPVAADADAALNVAGDRAARESDARALAGVTVRFVSEAAGPAFATREAALAAYAGRIEGGGPEDRWSRLVETLVDAAPTPARPAMRAGRRWPAAPASAPRTVWRIEVSYWRTAEARDSVLDQARALRRRSEARDLDAERLRALRYQPLRAVKPQQALDIGLFETRLPEAPHIVVADE